MPHSIYVHGPVYLIESDREGEQESERRRTPVMNFSWDDFNLDTILTHLAVPESNPMPWPCIH